MAKVQVLSAGFTQVLMGYDDKPMTQIRTTGEVFELPDKEIDEAPPGVLRRVGDDVVVTPPPMPMRLAPDAAVKLSTGDGVMLTAADFRSVEQANLDAALAPAEEVAAAVDKPKAFASTADWMAFAVGQGLDVDALSELKRDDIRALFDDEASDKSTEAWRMFALAAGFEAADIDGRDRNDIRSLFFE